MCARNGLFGFVVDPWIQPGDSSSIMLVLCLNWRSRKITTLLRCLSDAKPNPDTHCRCRIVHRLASSSAFQPQPLLRLLPFLQKDETPMTTLRRFTCNDLFTYNNVNLDILTETYNLPFYLTYLAKWPEYCLMAEGPGKQAMG